ncbi:Protein NLP3 [Phytophthora citrophthora]|uniref:Protein NLP3 n=1 Tax=Phytophthora citrophthora TaxID=4793 RepID=A0AAD9G3G5_9STRA|nr:Protein NLP3 [Phytophthora citrophthora]
MSSFSAIRLPHLSTTESFQYQFGGMPHAANYSSPAQERMALPPLNVLPSRVYAPSGYSQMQKPMVVASPAATLSHQPAQSPSKKRVRALPNASKSITLDMLRPHFEKPLAEVANIFGICMTLMKKICRKNGVPRWPHRQIRGLRKSIWSIEKALRCCESEAQRRSYNDHLQKQRAKLLTILKGPASPSSKAAFELVLSEPCSPMGEVATPTASEKTQSPTVRFQMPTVYSQVPSNMFQGNVSPKLPSIASLLMKNDEQRSNFNYQF